MSKYKFNKEVTQLLKDLKAAGGLKIEDLSPIEARNINLMDMPTPEVELVVEIGADGPFGPIQMYNYTPKGVSKDKPLPKSYHRDSQLNSRYTFANFIEGKSNQFAKAAAYSVGETPGQTPFNPLLIYSNPGLGKTHLLQAEPFDLIPWHQ